MKNFIRTKVFCVLFFILIGNVYAIDVRIAPITVFSQEEGKTALFDSTATNLLDNLNKYWLEGLVLFSAIPNTDVEQVDSVLDAVKVSIFVKSDYLLYGYIRHNDVSWTAELKLFNSATSKNIVSFFASDDIDNYDRLLETLARNISDWFSLQLGITSQYDMPEEARFALELPFSIGYWTYADSDWANVLLGSVKADVGLEFSPGIQLPIFFGKQFDISFGLNLGYRLGIGNPSAYKAYLHGISVVVPVFLNAYLTPQHKISFGLGFLYEPDFLLLYKNHEEPTWYITNQFGMVISAHYRYKLNDKFSLAAGFDFDLYFSKQTKPAFKTSFGAVYTIFERMDKIK